MRRLLDTGRRLAKIAESPKIRRGVAIIKGGEPSTSTKRPNPGEDYRANWRILDTENVTSYSSLDLANPWQVEFAASAPDVLRRRPSLHLMDSTWHLHRVNLDAFGELCRRAKAASPLAHFVVVCQTTFSAYRLSRAGIDSICMNSAAFEDDHALTIDQSLPPDAPHFEAIYNARLLPWKNHELANKLESLLLVYALFDGNQDVVTNFRNTLPNACFANHDLNEGTYRLFGASELSRLHAHVDVSLALSHEEGFMRASAQSLLCGKPVISVPSIGGRSRLYHDDTALIVDPAPEAIKAGVAEMKARGLSAEFVRRETLKLMQIERREILQGLGALRNEIFGPTARSLDFEILRGIKFRRHLVSDFIDELEKVTS